MQKKHYWIAAACITVAVISSLLFFRNSPERSAGAGAYIGQAMPSDDIRLISGTSITKLSQNSHISLKENGHAALINDSKQSEVILSKKDVNRLIVPYGKRSTLELSDGTKVWMNSGTELEFPSEFKGNTREIHLKGEIYIEVAPMKDKPFYVRTFDFGVQVFGTRFNVSAYPGKAEKTVVLAEGKVEVDMPGKGKSELLPEEMLRIDDSGMQKQKADVEKYISWKDGILIFHKTPVSDVLQKIGRYYNVSFDDFSDDLLSVKTCTGKLYLSDNLDEVLMSVAVLSETFYYKENGIIYIRNKPKLN
ncbi:MAG: FecR family protein [Mangrovibacterium sp.]